MPRRSQCVFGCLQFDVLHRFPKPEASLEQFLQWKEIVGHKMEDKTNDDIYINYRICNHHFEERFFYPQSKRLAKTAYPTLKLVEDVMDIVPSEITISDNRATAVSPSAPPMQEEVQGASSQSPAPQMSVSGSRAATVASPPPPQRERPRRNRNLNPRQSVAEQYGAARRELLAVAEANADTLRMLAAATQTQADAAKMQAEAAKVQAEASLLFAQAASKIADAVTIFINKNNK